MHLRASPTLAEDQVRAVVEALSQQWLSIPQLSQRLGFTTRAIRWAIKQASQHQPIFCRKGDPVWTAKQYRIVPEATQVQKG